MNNNNKDTTQSRFPRHWGEPPLRQTRDLRTLPGGYGRGSGTLAKWITENMARDQERRPFQSPLPSERRRRICGGANMAAIDQDVVESVRPTVEQHLARSFTKFQAVAALKQVVAGTMYYFKIDCGEAQHIAIKVMKELPHRGGGLILLGAQQAEAELSYFEGDCHVPVTVPVDDASAEDAWGELVGQDGEAAKEIVLRTPGVKLAGVVPEGSMVTMDYRTERVRIFVDAEGKVSRIPQRG